MQWNSSDGRRWTVASGIYLELRSQKSRNSYQGEREVRKPFKFAEPCSVITEVLSPNSRNVLT